MLSCSSFSLFLTFNGLLIWAGRGGVGIVEVVKGIEGQCVLVQASCFSFLAIVLQCSS